MDAAAVVDEEDSGTAEAVADAVSATEVVEIFEGVTGEDITTEV